MGRHRKPSRFRVAGRLPAVAVAAPALAGLAVAVCVSPQALAATPDLQAAAPATPTLTSALTVPQAGMTPVELLSAIRPSERHAGNSASSARYTVRAGDSLSAIAGRLYHQTSAWPVLYYANRGQVRSPDVLVAGQVLTIPAEPAHIPAAPATSNTAASNTAASDTAASNTATSSRAPSAGSASSTPAAARTTGASGGYPGGSFGECVVSRESGGNSQVMNGSGHYGLYQFSASTWAAYGGSPDDFGHASTAEQNQVFATALARGGQSNWSAYDGCLSLAPLGRAVISAARLSPGPPAR
jgi:LysM repeat protein